MPFTFQRTALKDLIRIIPKVFGDNRGFFLEYYKHSEFLQNGIEVNFLQDNHSKSVNGVLRGLHYQKEPFAQGKLVRCTQGEIFDVAVDIRQSSNTFKGWFGCILSADNKEMLYIPPGFAHGFLTLSAEAEVMYKTSTEYAPEYDCGIIWNDPDIGIKWPQSDIKLSDKDQNHPRLREAYLFD
ncbi:MAG: dTDP-4-dehydrorhamnose 3,5-epimerase [Caldithrix sp.]|nr:dTDP-4-dehydrorhamnose 3,5-epimerase [Caldithrix sp.]